MNTMNKVDALIDLVKKMSVSKAFVVTFADGVEIVTKPDKAIDLLKSEKTKIKDIRIKDEAAGQGILSDLLRGLLEDD